jgi:hypothetical protein
MMQAEDKMKESRHNSNQYGGGHNSHHNQKW